MVETNRAQEMIRRVVGWFWWACVGLSLVVIVGALPAYYAGLVGQELVAEFATIQQTAKILGVLFSLGVAIQSLVLAVIVYVKKTREPIAIFLSFFLLLYGVLFVGPLEHFLPYWFPSLGNLSLVLQGILLPVPLLVLMLIFPNGRFVPRGSYWVVVGATVPLGYALLATDLDEWLRMTSVRAAALYAILFILYLIALAIQSYRYTRLYTLVERQQTKWVLIALVVMLVLLILVSVPYYYVQNLPSDAPIPWWTPLNGLGWWFSLAILPFAFTVAILRYRLFDIDIIIRRTVTYSILTALLLGVYFGIVVLTQQLFRAVTGQNSELAIIVSTLAIAILFVPLRRRIQDFLDRRFYRKKYDAQQVLAKFAKTARDETDLNKLTDELMRVVDETMQPESVELWLKKTDRETRRRGNK